MDHREQVFQLAGQIRDDFQAQGRIRSYWEFLSELRGHPYRLLRSSAQYLRDMLDHFGSEEVQVLGEPVTRHKLFDGLECDPEAQRVVGQEHCIDAIYRIIRNFAHEGRADRLILMHGPNGSAKTTIADLIFKGLEAYSHTAEGVLYRFCWVFPKTAAGGGMGFGTTAQPSGDDETLAYIKPEDTATIVPSDMKTNPIFLVPQEQREALLREICGGKPDFPHVHILRGDLGTKSREIHEALLTAYQGDWRRVMGHIRVERFYVSRRYRAAAVSIEPQSNVDAEARQMTADASIANLPAALQNLRLYEVGGDLVDANRGVVEYSDFLKRPLDYNKYLLTTTEKGTIRLPGALAYLDLVMIGSANEKHLDGFKTDPNFTSFKGRMELVTVPYVLEYEKEVQIYRDQLQSIAERKHIAPHAARATALWAILTRLWKPDPNHYPERLREVMNRLTPLAKALLYQGRDPGELERFSAEEVKHLRAALPRISSEYRTGVVYEGRFGASPREMKTILVGASYREETKCLTPITVVAQLKALVRDKTVYDFLKLEPKGTYNDPARFVDDIDRAVVRVVLREMKDSMALVDEEEYDRRFDEYFQHAIAYTRGSKVRDPISGDDKDPDPSILNGVEKLLETGDDIDLFRQNLIAKIGADAVNRPGEKVNFRKLFPDILRSLKTGFYTGRGVTIGQIQKDFSMVGTPDFDKLPTDRQEQVERTLTNMDERYGYCRDCALEMAAYALKKTSAQAQDA